MSVTDSQPLSNSTWDPLLNHTDNNNNTGPPLSIQDFYSDNAPVGVAVDRMITPVFYLIGLPCNPLCAFIWLGRQTRRNNSSAVYLGALSISHTIFLPLHFFVVELNYAWGIKTFDGYVWCEVFFTLYYCPQYLAPLLVLGFTVERYIAICHPFVKEKYCTVCRAVWVVVLLLLFSLALSSVQAYLWTYDPEIGGCNHRLEVRDTKFPSLWTWVTELIVFGVAPLAALVFNVLVIREIRSLTTRGPAIVMPGSGHNQAQTVTLLTVSFYLVCTWLPATLVYSLEREFPFGDGPTLDSDAWRRHFTYYTVRKFVEEVTLSNSACYFFIYYLTGKHFRDRVKDILCPRNCKMCPRSSSARNQDAKKYIAVPGKADNGHTCVTNV
ncbi:hypothetical protein BaRGS_00012667 [Batillaria attramentaria]|uniref:G-protein coupled receptors family 1 profile domain-containing protein n=1 Tax=Batillaria attramentaria TaxID=370345 RepID=A0ABD0L9K3_9CAEN|nr:hypothetical protein BaRGS_010802 [Batillaria attramentaria]